MKEDGKGGGEGGRGGGRKKLVQEQSLLRVWHPLKDFLPKLCFAIGEERDILKLSLCF